MKPGFVCHCSACCLKGVYLRDLTTVIVDLSRLDFDCTVDKGLIPAKYRPTPKVKAAQTPAGLSATDSTTLEQKEEVTPKEVSKESSMALPTEIEELLNEMIEGNTAGELDSNLTEGLAQFMVAYEYKGFDPIKIRTTLAQQHGQFPDGATLWLTEARQLVIKGPNKFNLLVSYLVALFNIRGNNLAAIKDGLEKTGQTAWDKFLLTIRLQSSVARADSIKSCNTLTLSRISSAFPIHSMNVVCRPEYLRVIVDLTDIGLAQGSTDLLGKCLAHPACPSVLTKEHKKAGFAAVTFLVSLRLNKIIGEKTKTSMSRLWLYHKSALNSVAVTETIKLRFWKSKWDADVANPALEAAKTALKDMLANEKATLDEVLAPM